MRKTQEQQKITSYGQNKSLLDFYQVHNGAHLKPIRYLLWKLGNSISICIKIGVWFCITTSDVFSTF